MPKTIETLQQKQNSLVEALFCVGMKLKTGQDAAKMRQDGPDEPFESFLNAKMAPQNPSKLNTNSPKKQWKKSMEKQRRRITIGLSVLGRRSAPQRCSPNLSDPLPLQFQPAPGRQLISLKYQASSLEVNLLRFRPSQHRARSGSDERKVFFLNQ